MKQPIKQSCIGGVFPFDSVRFRGGLILRNLSRCLRSAQNNACTVLAEEYEEADTHQHHGR